MISATTGEKCSPLSKPTCRRFSQTIEREFPLVQIGQRQVGHCLYNRFLLRKEVNDQRTNHYKQH